jgi:mono/diheme cytochrome c family protein
VEQILPRVNLRAHPIRLAVVAVAALALLIQAAPYGHAHSNPPVTKAAHWPRGPGEQLAEGSCYDCHSNLTHWRWYSNVAPFSWLVQHDVEDGRAILDFSEWDRGQPSLDELSGVVSTGQMPPTKYTLVHPSAKLTPSEREALVTALAGLYAKDPPATESR